MEKTIYSFRRKKIELIPAFLFCIFFIVFFFYFLIEKGPVLLVIGTLLAGIIVLQPGQLLTKITISPDGIQYKSLQKNYFLSWATAKSFGAFEKTRFLRDERYGIDFTTGKVVDTNAEIWIYVSLKKNYNPGPMESISENYIDFEFDAKAWFMIQSYFEIKHTAASAYLYPPDSDPGFGH